MSLEKKLCQKYKVGASRALIGGLILLRYRLGLPKWNQNCHIIALNVIASKPILHYYEKSGVNFTALVRKYQ
jgi:hypothetical protein